MKEILEEVGKAEEAAIEKNKPDVMLCGNISGPLSARKKGIPAVMTILQPHGEKTLQYFSKNMAKNAETNNFIVQVLSGIDLLLIEGTPELGPDIDSLLKENSFMNFKNKVRFTGPLLPENPDAFPSQEELKIRYLGNKDQPLVYATIGGGSQLIGKEFLRQVLDMFRSLPEVKGIISTGLAIAPEKIAEYNPPDNVSIHSFVPGTEVIKASDLVVFHGGSSTLMTCLACGKPGIAVPSMDEQEDNGNLLAQKGAGIVLEKSSLTAGILREAVKKILDDSTFLTNAQKLQALCQKYGGAPKAACLVEDLFHEKVLP